MIYDAMLQLLQPSTLLAVFIGTIAGVVIGGMPGLTATMAVALLIPLTFSLEPVIGLVLMGGVYSGAMYGGSIPAILLNAPGTPAAVATAIEGYPLAQQGKAHLALKVSAVASFIGGIFSAFILLLLAPILAEFALNFGPPEKFLLASLGLAGIVSLCDKENPLVKTLLAGLFGMFLAIIGTDPVSGDLRFAFGLDDLYDGVNMLPALIGLFSMTQMITIVSNGAKNDMAAIKDPMHENEDKEQNKMPKGLGKFMAMGAGTGTVVGALPGEGATIATFLSYNFAKRLSKMKEKFGYGAPEGIAAAEAGNNGCVGGSLIPTLTLGIPGNSVAAALLGGLIVHGLIPGPELFTVHAEITYTFIVSLLFANVIFLVVGLTLAPYLSYTSKIPFGILVPAVTLFSILGAYSIDNSVFDVFVMMAFAALGFVFALLRYSTGALILGLILGPIAESGFSQSMLMGGGEYGIFAASSEAKVLLVIITLLVALPLWRIVKESRQQKALVAVK